MRTVAPGIRRRSRVIPPLEGAAKTTQVAKPQFLGHIPWMMPLRKQRTGGAVQRTVVQHAKARLTLCLKTSS